MSYSTKLLTSLSLATSVVFTAHCNRAEPDFREQGEGDRSGTAETHTATPHEAEAPPARPARPLGLPAPADVAAVPADAQRTSTGLASRVLQPGTGTTHPGATDRVTVHYTGWTTDGQMFDSSVVRGTPATFGLNQVITGWTEGLQLMVQGEKRRFWIPQELAYQGRPGGPAGMLVFDVELQNFVPGPPPPAPPPPAPPDVSAAPRTAERTASGLQSRVLRRGTGTTHPTAQNVVRVHYTGWTTDGQMFDSSVTRGEPAEFPLGNVIAGWTEGLQLMVEGEKRRLWIPESLAYQGRPGRPAGMLVFDVELLNIVR